tara:strand:+ start:1115 stop:1723 length:609 start_codon:yes stop_codon:yes gene_type:complete
MEKNNQISCICGQCGLELNDTSPKYSLMCACEDCRQALSWAEKNGGKKPKNILYSVYLRSDISNHFGLKNMVVTHLRDDASSTRVYCKKCYSCIAIDHVNYHNNVFMIQPDHCKQNFNVHIPPKAVINLQDHPEDFIELDSDTIPVFHSRRYPQERKRFLSIEPISEFLAPPKTQAKGITLRDLISKIGTIKVLHLTKGKAL